MENVTIVENVTYSELVALIASESLEAGVNYMITDRGDRGLLFKAASKTQLETDGTRYMLCPAWYGIGSHEGNNWIGVWNATKTANQGDLTIWNGLVWKAKGSVIAAQGSPNSNATDWELIPKSSFANGEYVEMIFGVRYSLQNDWISTQWDNMGNVFGLSYEMEQDWWFFGFNMCDYSDWNIQSGNTMFFAGNKCFGVYNNSNTSDIYANMNIGVISENSNNGTISYNRCLGSIKNNSNGGNISYNNNTSDIYDNVNDGEISFNSNTGAIFSNANSGAITDNSNISDIYSNENAGFIMFNSNKGSIKLNSNVGNISNNSNNGIIGENSSTLSCHIKNNINNGSIMGSWDADIADIIVDKTGTV